MTWIKLSTAAERAKISERTAQRRLKSLEKLDKALYKKLVKYGKPIKVKAPEIVAYFQTSPMQFRKRLDVKNLKRKSGPRKPDDSKRGIPKEVEEFFYRTVHDPVVLNIEPDIEEIYHGIVEQHGKERFIIAVKICHDYMTGYEGIEECSKANGIAPRTFFNWCQSCAEVSWLYKRAKTRRGKIVQERDLEDSINIIRKLMNGYKDQVTKRTYKIVTGLSGQDVFLPVGMEVQEKSFQPHFGAAVFMSTNRDPQNWKRHTPIEELLKPPVQPKDQFDHMSDEDLDEYIKKSEKLLNK